MRRGDAVAELDDDVLRDCVGVEEDGYERGGEVEEAVSEVWEEDQFGLGCWWAAGGHVYGLVRLKYGFGIAKKSKSACKRMKCFEFEHEMFSSFRSAMSRGSGNLNSLSCSPNWETHAGCILKH